MAKLPPQFVKAPPADPAAPARRTRKPSLVAAAAAAPRDPREVLVHLTDDDHRALEDARAALRDAGEDVTLEQMIHRVLADWTMRVRAAAAAAVAPAPEPAPRVDGLVDRLRALAAAPLRTWRELGATVRRMIAAQPSSSR